MLTGEWAVLELNAPCIVLAVDKYVKVSLEEEPEMTISAKDLNINDVQAEYDKGHLVLISKLTEEKKNKLAFAKEAIQTVLCYLTKKGKTIKGFEMSIDSEMTKLKLRDCSMSKVGFGSSASVVVGIIAALLKMHGEEIDSFSTKRIVYKLGCIAHYLAQGNIGSGFDVASSTYGGVLVYKRFDPKWLVRQLHLGRKLSHIIKSKWKNFHVTQQTLPKDFTFCVGFCGYQASTRSLVLKMEKYKEQDKEGYRKMINDIKIVTNRINYAIMRNDKDEILQLLDRNRLLLKKLGETSGTDLETRELNEMIEIANGLGASAKFSGAGGGDCVIAVCFDKEKKRDIERAWRQRNFYPLKVRISKQGVHMASN